LFVANRVYVIPQATNGQTLKLFTDTGGGLFVTESAAQRLEMKTTKASLDASGESAAPRQLAALPQFKSGFGIPAPADDDGRIPLMPADRVEKNHFTDDGMLGEAWFGGRVWTWDYPHERLTLEGSRWKPAAGTARVALGFPVVEGKRGDNFARITIRVDGKSIDVLLDTGATTTLGADAMKALDDKGPAQRATSFIVDAQFQEWRKAHPDWRVIEKAEHDRVPMIEVPQVEIAGASFGPVWFTWRPDKAFHEYMSSMMDKQVEGAIGGNALSHFVMTIDYPGATAYFRCLRDCRNDRRN
jgi:hypothetical protein